jgi:hypothetical protein
MVVLFSGQLLVALATPRRIVEFLHGHAPKPGMVLVATGTEELQSHQVRFHHSPLPLGVVLFATYCAASYHRKAFDQISLVAVLTTNRAERNAMILGMSHLFTPSVARSLLHGTSAHYPIAWLGRSWQFCLKHCNPPSGSLYP